MSEMVERVARATWEHWRTLPIASEECADCDWNEINRLADLPPLESSGRNPATVIRDAALSQARATIEAMEAPIEAMIDAGCREMALRESSDSFEGTVKDVYQAMIKAALDERFTTFNNVWIKNSE